MISQPFPGTCVGMPPGERLRVGKIAGYPPNPRRDMRRYAAGKTIAGRAKSHKDCAARRIPPALFRRGGGRQIIRRETSKAGMFSGQHTDVYNRRVFRQHTDANSRRVNR